MTPVMTSTKTDRSTIDLAGVEAGEKMLVLWSVERPGATAQSDLADQNKRSAVCQPAHKVEFVLRADISFLPFFTSGLADPQWCRGKAHERVDLSPSEHIPTHQASSFVLPIDPQLSSRC